MKNYDHKKIEKKWQGEWDKKKIYKTEAVSKKKKFYVLDMFPYPSGVGLHVGHPRGYIGSDVYARMKRMQGYNVLHPMGYDAFGLPAEQYALEHKIHPSQAVNKNVATFEKQLSIMGLSYDWSRRVNTTDPAYYKWTQWIFLQIYNSWFDKTKNKARPIKDLISIFNKEGNTKVNAVCSATFTTIFTKDQWKAYDAKEQQAILMNYRLAYEGYAEVNWCPELGTVLANDEVVEDKKGALVSERGGFAVVKMPMRQWFMRIVAYADRLLDGLESLNWSSHIKEIQKNWIGKSEGSEITFEIRFDNNAKSGMIPVFTTRADTLFGVTYIVLAPEHPWVTLAIDDDHKGVIKNRDEVKKYVELSKKKDDMDRTALGKEKTGVKLEGVRAVNPANGKEVPVYVADYVLAQYGTGAVMAVPAHDERDFEFAKKYNLPVTSVIIKNDGVSDDGAIVQPFLHDGVLINSQMFTGLDSNEARKKITEAVGGKIVTKYKMRDAIFARQRYWGEPIPLIHDKKTGLIKEVPVSKLPLKLPNVKSYMPTGTGESPLASVKAWKDAGFETNTMPGWAGSSWYFLRYMDPKNTKEFASKKSLKYWKDVDMYIGGQEHATGHLLYSRFWHAFLYDMGYVPTKEPFKTLKNQGMILATDNRKMSKRWGNVVNPDDIVATYGADTLRLYEMFIGPFDQAVAWSTESIIGPRRFLERVWKVGTTKLGQTVSNTSFSPLFSTILHKTIKKVSEDIESMSFNTAVSSMMVLLNEMEKQESISVKDFKLFLQVMAPFAPYIADELWHTLGEKKSIHISGWPKYDPKKIIEAEVKIAIQVNGKVRAEMMTSSEMSEDDVKKEALSHSTIASWIDGKEIKRIIYVKGRLVNIVV